MESEINLTVELKLTSDSKTNVFEIKQKLQGEDVVRGIYLNGAQEYRDSIWKKNYDSGKFPHTIIDTLISQFQDLFKGFDSGAKDSINGETENSQK